ncbi:MAG: carboxypeptidase regulatory-like domain-containing protein [Gemmatimonadales bacterium]|nr:carboxypeptidase regulatory-like domain-containing protein [Gemmatimonadales bacterium]
MTSRRVRLRLAIAIVLGLTPLALPVAAQERGARLSGILVSERDGTPVDGAIVSLVGLDDAVLGETLSDGRGAFNLPLPPPGAYRVVVARIGYDSWTSGSIRIDSAQATGPLRLEIPVQPIPLPELMVTEQTDCPTTPEERQRAFDLYESVVPILASVSHTEDIGHLRMRIVRPIKEWRRGQFLYGYDTTAVVQSRSLYNASPGYLATHGYAEAINDTLTTFYVPDGDALVSPGFLATHCLSTTEAEDEGTAGLAFEPRPGREVVEVSGVLWIDTMAVEPRELEFRYVSLGPFLRRHLEPALRADIQSRFPRPRFARTRILESRFRGWLRFGMIAPDRWVIQEWKIDRPILLYELATGVMGTFVTPVAFPVTTSGKVLSVVPP